MLLWVMVSGCAYRGPLVPYTQTVGYHAIGNSVYGVLEQDLNDDGLTDVVLARRDDKGFRLNVQQRKDPAGTRWTDVCSTDPVRGEEVASLAWLGDGVDHTLAILVLADENPEEVIQHFVVADARHGCNVAWADMVTIPRREMPMMRAASMPPEGLSWVAMGNALRLVDKTQVVGLQGAEGAVGLLAQYRERVGTIQDGHLKVEEATKSALRAKAARVIWRQGDQNQGVPELSDGNEDTVLAIPAGMGGGLTIESTDLVVLVEVHHGCDIGQATSITLTHSGQSYETGTVPTEHAPFRAAGRRHPKGQSYTQELLALRDPVHHIQFDLAASDKMRCLREVTVYGW